MALLENFNTLNIAIALVNKNSITIYGQNKMEENQGSDTFIIRPSRRLP